MQEDKVWYHTPIWSRQVPKVVCDFFCLAFFELN